MANFINLADFEQVKSTQQTNPEVLMRAYYDTKYDIPIECQNRLIPNNAMSVLDYIQLELPKTTSAILLY